LDPNNIAYDNESVPVVDVEKFVSKPTIGKSVRIFALKVFKNGFGFRTWVDFQHRFNSRPNIPEWIFFFCAMRVVVSIHRAACSIVGTYERQYWA
jgi:hypothetical protein